MSHTSRLRQRWWSTWLWWRHTWWFQFAHAPLCERFAADVLQVGRWRFCRSCALLYTGGLATLIGLASMPAVHDAVPALAIALMAVILPLSYPPWYARLDRRTRDGLRFGAGVLLTLWLATGFVGSPLLATGIGALLLPIYLLYRQQRARCHAHACAGCHELDRVGVCSGYSLQARSIRAYCEQMEDRLNGNQPPPPLAQRPAPRGWPSQTRSTPPVVSA